MLDPAGLRTAQDQSGLNLESDHYFQLSSFEISTWMEGREELQFISNYASFTIVKFLKIMVPMKIKFLCKYSFHIFEAQILMASKVLLI